MSNSKINSYLDIALNLVKRDLKVKYKKSIFGIAWSLLNPLVMLLVYTFAFKIVLKSNIENFSLFLLSGILPWNLFSSTVMMSSSIITGNMGLINKIYFPREIFIVASTLFNLFMFLMMVVILAISMPFFHVTYSFNMIITFILALILLLAFALGLGLFAAALSVKYRDVPHLLEILFMAWFWLTPILYQSSAVPVELSFFVQYNPMALVIDLFRYSFIGTQYEGNWIFSTVIIIFALFTGYIYFKKQEPNFSELL